MRHILFDIFCIAGMVMLWHYGWQAPFGVALCFIAHQFDKHMRGL